MYEKTGNYKYLCHCFNMFCDMNRPDSNEAFLNLNIPSLSKKEQIMIQNMKKQIFLLFTVVLMLSCSNTGSPRQTESALTVESGLDKHSEAYIRQRIDTIYKGVGISTDNPFNRDSVFCSQRYYALMQEALIFSNEMGDILYDYDYWVCGQDISDDWNYKVANVYEITDSTALVDLLIHNFNDTKTTIALRFERNDWYIDDFSPSKDGNDDKKYLRDTIRQGLEMRKKAKAS